VTDIVQHTGGGDLLPSEQRQLNLMWRQAQRLAASDLVPDAYRKKPENIIAVALYGRSFGLDAMTAVQNIHVIKGRFVPSAQVLAGVLMRAGHEVRIPEQDAERCVVRIKRRGDADWQQVTCTIDDARKAKLLEKDIWKQYPADMLGHFTMRRAARRICPDTVLGLDLGGDEGVAMGGYLPDRDENGRVIDVDVSDFDPDGPAELTEHTVDGGGDDAAPTPVVDVVASEAVPPVSAPRPPTPPPVAPESDEPVMMTPEQQRHVHALFRQFVPPVVGAQRHEMAAKFVGRPVASLHELTQAEMSSFIDALDLDLRAAQS
jgi:hypothetical protein